VTIHDAMEATMTSVYVPQLSRRASLHTLAAAGLCASAGLPWPSAARAQAASPSDLKDEDIFQFALNLEYMEAEYYLRATTGKGIDAADLGSDPGQVIVREPDGETSALAQGGIVFGPVRHPVPLLGNVMPASSIGLEGHGRYPT
jgi:hypothetical protein